MHDSIARGDDGHVGLHDSPTGNALPETSWSRLRRGVERESSAFGRGAAYAWQDFGRWIGEIKTLLKPTVKKPDDRASNSPRTGPRATMIPSPTHAHRG